MVVYCNSQHRSTIYSFKHKLANHRPYTCLRIGSEQVILLLLVVIFYQELFCSCQFLSKVDFFLSDIVTLGLNVEKEIVSLII